MPSDHSNRISAIDLGERAVLRLTGGDRLRYLNGQVSNDVRKLSGENSIAACVTTIKGKLDALVHITEIGDAYLIDAEAELREALLARLGKYIIADDCELEDVSARWRIVHVLGDAASQHPVRCSERYGQPGRDLWLPAGEPLPADFEVLSAAATETLRIRNGIPKWGVELTPDTLPAEAGLDAYAIDFHKGCYVGQEVISRIKSVGRVNRKLVRLRSVAAETSESPDPNSQLPTAHSALPIPQSSLPIPQSEPTPLFDAEKEVGQLTSVAGRDALAFVRRDHNSPGTLLTLGSPADPDKKYLSTWLEIVDSRLV